VGGGGIFTATNPWSTPVDADPKSAESDAIVAWLASNGGWGAGAMYIDFSITVQQADASTPLLTFNPTGDFYTPDCDHVPFPVPPGGALEGEQGYSCTQNGDCHLIVIHAPTHKLYEMWRADMTGGTFNGGCTAVWDLTKTYPPNLRGDGCTSADGGGFPIAAMLFNADEVYAQEIPHAIRFILPNERIRAGTYVHPGSHTTSTSGGSNAPPYGVRFRLRADFPLANLPSDGARVVAKAMQKYGMFLADGGNIALTAADDRFTQHKWTDVGVDAQSLKGIQPSDMEVVDMGTPMTITDCTRNP
jgi:serine/threonine-protein kinase